MDLFPPVDDAVALKINQLARLAKHSLDPFTVRLAQPLHRLLTNSNMLATILRHPPVMYPVNELDLPSALRHIERIIAFAKLRAGDHGLVIEQLYGIRAHAILEFEQSRMWASHVADQCIERIRHKRLLR